ncbi:MAG TPA: hypothetical protein VME22_05115 [Solirubrobacteraceae bacterium]|nr:hypothetical protein [Solirubrobacteraceae bacterium]
MSDTHATRPAHDVARASKPGRRGRLTRWARIAAASGVEYVHDGDRREQLVGFYTDAAGNVDGLLATPVRNHHGS